MLKPENKKKSAHYFSEKNKHSEINKYVYFRVILPMLIPGEIRY